MADEKSSPEEFRSFIRELGVRAFDQLAARFAAATEAVAEQSDRVTRRSASLSRLAGYWSAMQPGEKELFFDQMIAAAQTVAAAAPGMLGMARLRKKKRGLPELARKDLRTPLRPDPDIDETPIVDLEPDPAHGVFAAATAERKKSKKKKKKKDKLEVSGDHTDNGRKKKKKKKKKRNKS